MPSAGCQVCTHPLRAEIDFALASGEAQRAVARRFGLHQQQMHRHAKGGHVGAAIVKAVEATEIRRARSLWERQQELVADFEWARAKLREHIEATGYNHDSFCDWHVNAGGRGSAMRFEVEVQRLLLEHASLN